MQSDVLVTPYPSWKFRWLHHLASPDQNWSQDLFPLRQQIPIYRIWKPINVPPSATPASDTGTVTIGAAILTCTCSLPADTSNFCLITSLTQLQVNVLVYLPIYHNRMTHERLLEGRERVVCGLYNIDNCQGVLGTQPRFSLKRL